MAESLSEVPSSVEALGATDDGKSSNKTLMIGTRLTMNSHQEKEPSLTEKEPLEEERGPKGGGGEKKKVTESCVMKAKWRLLGLTGEQ